VDHGSAVLRHPPHADAGIPCRQSLAERRAAKGLPALPILGGKKADAEAEAAAAAAVAEAKGQRIQPQRKNRKKK